MHTAFPSFPRFFGRQKRKKSRLKFAFWQLFLKIFRLKKAAGSRLSENPLIGFSTTATSTGSCGLLS